EEPIKPVEVGLPAIYATGSNKDVKTNHKAGLLLAGGGTDVDEAMKWMVTNANGGDIVVIRTSGSDGYNTYLFSQLGVSVNSVRSLVIDSRDKANKDSVFNMISNAEALFIAGGDQSTYLRLWKETKVDSAIKYLLESKKVTIGGTSAGMAILSEFAYSGERGSVVSEEALMNPFHQRITIDKSFINASLLQGYITDTHFSQRDRFGRLVTFMARVVKEHKISPKAIACDEYSAVCIESNGIATVYGQNAFFIETLDTTALTCKANIPLNWEEPSGSLRYTKIRGNLAGTSKFNLKEWNSNPNPWTHLNILNGVLTEF
ncbi:MAG: cyanophycinase, partial [Bacteroidales bacterium]|nr:cyanophycinase [Bacteroidales bacterium]